jgi:molecular chaperone DnaK
LDVTPLSLGVEVEGGLFVKLIEKNTTIPTQRKEEFTTASDYQPAVDIFVYQGERPMAKDNRLLGNFKLDGIPPAPRGIPRIEVAFDIDVNGILNVSAKDTGTGKEQKITIESSSGLTEKQINKMCKEAEQNADEDAKRKEKVETINKAEQVVYSSKKVLKDNKDKLDEDDVASIEEALDSLKDAVEAEDLDEIKKCQEDLEHIQGEVFTKLYENQTPPTPDPSEAVEDEVEEENDEEEADE